MRDHSIRLKQVLAIHDRHVGRGQRMLLGRSIGDGYLMARNPTFRKVRLKAWALGYRFTTAGFPLYDVFPLGCLDEILRRKRVPYFNNLDALEFIENSRPGHFSLKSCGASAIRANYVLHEAAHGIAHEALVSVEDGFFKALLGEAFANACEYWAQVDAQDEVHRFFLRANSYMVPDPAAAKDLAWLGRICGEETAFRLVFLLFLLANFFVQRPSGSDLDRVLRIARFEGGRAESKKTRLLLRRLVRERNLGLHPRFVVATGRVYFALHRFPGRFLDYLKKDPLGMLTDGVPEFW